MSSSFQRKVKSKLPDIPGVYPSLYTSQLLVSSGVPDLDHLLGGGVAVGSVLLLVEDRGEINVFKIEFIPQSVLILSHCFLPKFSTKSKYILENPDKIVQIDK